MNSYDRGHKVYFPSISRETWDYILQSQGLPYTFQEYQSLDRELSSFEHKEMNITANLQKKEPYNLAVLYHYKKERGYRVVNFALHMGLARAGIYLRGPDSQVLEDWTQSTCANMKELIDGEAQSLAFHTVISLDDVVDVLRKSSDFVPRIVRPKLLLK